jgi:signal transduction histidine kinase
MHNHGRWQHPGTYGRFPARPPGQGRRPLDRAGRDRFWANVSHELRTPLNSITGLTRLLADPAGGLGAEQLHQVELIRKASATLLTLVNDLLDVAKAESGRFVIDPAEVSLPALLAGLRGLTRPLAEDKPVNVVISADGAEDGVQALAAVSTNHVDLVLADLGMPRTDGRSLLDQLPPPPCQRSSSPAGTSRRRLAPPACCTRISSPGNGWRSPSGGPRHDRFRRRPAAGG